jgi:hypothetical protein
MGAIYAVVHVLTFVLLFWLVAVVANLLEWLF